MNGRGRASEMVDLIHLQQKRLNDVVSNKLKPRVSKMVHHVLFTPSKEIINDDHAIPSSNQTVHEVATDEPGPTGDHNPQTFPFKAQRYLTPRMEGCNAVVDGGLTQLKLIGESDPAVLFLLLLGVRLIGGDEAENESGNSNADEDEDETLFAKHVADGSNHVEPWLVRFG